MSAGSKPSVQQKPKLLDRVRAAIRSRHYSPRTEEAYVAWMRISPIVNSQIAPS
jgi:hypothetical protein